MIVRLIAHKIVKEANQTANAELVRRNGLIDNSTDAANHLYTSAKKSLVSRGATGKFSRETDGENPSPFEGYTTDYISEQTDEKFYEYSVLASEGLRNSIRSAAAATGGYVVFIHYKITRSGQDKHNILVALISEQGMPVFDENLNLNESNILDLNNLKHCVRVRVDHLEQNTDQVVQFLSGRGSGEVALYFKWFIGCTQTTSSKENAIRLKDRLTDWSNERNLSSGDKITLFSRVYSYWRESNGSKQGLLMERLANYLYPDDPDSFLSFMTDEESGVPGELPRIASRDMSRFKQFKYQSKDFSLQFSRTEWSDKVNYNENDGVITISDPPEGLVDMLEAENLG